MEENENGREWKWKKMKMEESGNENDRDWKWKRMKMEENENGRK